MRSNDHCDGATMLKLNELQTGTERASDSRAGGGAYLHKIRRLLTEHRLFLICFFFPVSLATLYYGLLASDMYVSESRFIVRSASITPRLGGLGGGVAQVSTLVRTNDDTQAVNEYMVSRDALTQLINENHFLDVVGRPEADFLARFPRFGSDGNRERLFDRMREFIDLSFDGSTGISSLRVRAFRAEDAKQIAQALFFHAEKLINRLNTRARSDAIAFAEEVLRKSEANAEEAKLRLAEFRNREGVFDPVRQAAASLELINKLSGEIAELNATLSELGISSPNSPKVEGIKSRIKGLEDQVREQRSNIGGGPNSLALKLAEFDKLTLENELAAKTLLSALASLENAREDASRKQLYLEIVVEPNLPDQSRYPHRFSSILYIAGISLCLYWILSVLIRTVLAHEA